jgi:hypothetical protein
VPFFINLNDGDEIQFGTGEQGAAISRPSPHLCNLHLAIARVFAASGFAEVVDRFMEEWNDDDASGRVDVGAAAFRALLGPIRQRVTDSVA